MSLEQKCTADTLFLMSFYSDMNPVLQANYIQDVTVHSHNYFSLYRVHYS